MYLNIKALESTLKDGYLHLNLWTCTCIYLFTISKFLKGCAVYLLLIIKQLQNKFFSCTWNQAESMLQLLNGAFDAHVLQIIRIQIPNAQRILWKLIKMCCIFRYISKWLWPWSILIKEERKPWKHHYVQLSSYLGLIWAFAWISVMIPAFWLERPPLVLPDLPIWRWFPTWVVPA